MKLTEWRLASSRGRITARREGHCWCPVATDAKPYPWPWTGAPRWVEAETVYLKNTLIQQPLSDKELSQLMDLREDWGSQLIHLLLEWDQGASPPLRMSVEFILAAWTWLGVGTHHVLHSNKTSLAG